MSAGHGVCLVRADGLVTWIGAAALRDARLAASTRSWATRGELVPEAVVEGRQTPLQLALRRGREGSGTFTRSRGATAR